MTEVATRGGYERELDEADQLLDEVERALARLDDGTYGTCEACGQAIGEDRLVAFPLVRTCDRHPLLTDDGGHPAPGDVAFGDP